MQREYLEEDLQLIRAYFPGAQTVALRTPFDFTPKDRSRLPEEAFRAEPGGGRWYGDLAWNR